MAPPTVQTLQRLAAETGYRLDTLEKVLRLLELLDEIAQDPVLSQRLVLKGGTALNVFYLNLDRLSVDIDLNYAGALDLAAMEREHSKVDAAIHRLLASHGYAPDTGPVPSPPTVAPAHKPDRRVRTRDDDTRGVKTHFSQRACRCRSLSDSMVGGHRHHDTLPRPPSRGELA